MYCKHACAGFEYQKRVEGYIKDYRRVFFQGSTDHRCRAPSQHGNQVQTCCIGTVAIMC